jgi:hypothetical protein
MGITVKSELDIGVFWFSLAFLFGFKVRSSQGHGAHQDAKKDHDPMRFSHLETPLQNQCLLT